MLRARGARLCEITARFARLFKSSNVALRATDLNRSCGLPM